MENSILLVDDDPLVLSALERQLRKQFDLTTTLGGPAALKAVEDAANRKRPFAVAICDMHMPDMNGIEVLSRIKKCAPDTVRMMLTGDIDQGTTINAINQGGIFRFYTKPCLAEHLAEGIEAGVEQYRLITAERELLDYTLTGSVKMLVDVMSMNDPLASQRTTRLRDWVQLLTVKFKMPQRWQLEVAATLAPIGLVAIPPEVIAKRRRGETLTEVEQSMFEQAPKAGRDLIANIPRLVKVAETVYLQDRGYDGSGFPPDGPVGNDIPADARLLKILNALAECGNDSMPNAATFASLERRRHEYDPALLAKVRACLEGTSPPAPIAEIKVPLEALRAGTFVLSNIRLTNGHLIVAANTQLSEGQIERLRNLRKIFPFVEPIRVRVQDKSP